MALGRRQKRAAEKWIPPKTVDAEFGADFDTERTHALRWSYEELIRIEGHYTEQIQNQQRRIAAVLAVNGFLLAFLASAGLQIQKQGGKQHWYQISLDVCLILLSLALIFGVVSLLPQIRIGGAEEDRGWLAHTFLPRRKDPDLWLDSRTVWTRLTDPLPPDAAPSTRIDSLLSELCASAAANAEANRDHLRINVWRRFWMNFEIVFILLALVALVVAVCGWMASIL